MRAVRDGISPGRRAMVVAGALAALLAGLLSVSLWLVGGETDGALATLVAGQNDNDIAAGT